MLAFRLLIERPITASGGCPEQNASLAVVKPTIVKRVILNNAARMQSWRPLLVGWAPLAPADRRLTRESDLGRYNVFNKLGGGQRGACARIWRSTREKARYPCYTE